MMKHPFSRFFGVGEKVEEAEREIISENEEVRKIPTSCIVPNRFQPRTIFDDNKIEELARTIHTHGIIQPIVVREYSTNQFEIIAGERRFRAVQKLGWDKVPAIIKNLMIQKRLLLH